MKASELRIGNYVNVPNYEQCPFRIDAFEHCSEKFIKVAQEVKLNGFEVHPITWYGDNLQPIPLTVEWLLKFGFEKSGLWTYVIELQGNLKLVYYLGEKGWSIGFKSYSDFSNLYYVHQLQNLYFALTGEELTIKKQNQ
jgi:hypothetical protein